MNNKPLLLVGDGEGHVFEIPGIRMIGMSLNTPTLADKKELIQLPYGSSLYELPDRVALGYDPQNNKVIRVPRYQGKRVYPVAAHMAPGHTQVYRAAYQKEENATVLSLFAYTAVGWLDGLFWVPGIRVDSDIRQDIDQFDTKIIEKQTIQTLKKYPNNRLVSHLVENCVRRYGCPAAQNFVLERWECPVPTSPACNAKCVGCISWQSGHSCISPSQNRLSFVPSVKEIVQFTIPHLENAANPIISFGQGCEGEPLLQSELIARVIETIRNKTSKGTINLNTNASIPDAIEKLCKVGLDTVRISLNSAQEYFYNQYFKPIDYTYKDVIESIKIARHYNCGISINYFIFPGFTDTPTEMSSFISLAKTCGVDFIQMRNLNIDPDLYIETLGLDSLGEQPIGLRNWMDRVRKQLPHIAFGYYNPSKESLKKIKV